MKTLGTLLGGVFLTALAASAQSTPVTCTNATLNGTYSLVLTGRDVLPSAALTKVYLSVGTATFDGAGNFTMSLTAFAAGGSAGSKNWSGTYSLPSSCLGTLTASIGEVALFTLIPYNNGNDFTLTGQDGTYEYTGSGAPQPAACLAATFSGPFAFTGTGYTLSSGSIVGVDGISGLLQFDGVGNITANWTVTTGSTSTPDTLTGKFTFGTSCQATATLTDSKGAVFNVNLVLTTSAGADFGFVISNATNAFTGAGHATFTNPGAAVELVAGSGLPTVPGSLISIYGSDLAAGTGQLTGFPLPPTLESASVTVNGETVPLYFVSTGLINAQLPLDIAPGVATLVVKNGSAVSNSVAINVSATAQPAVLIYGANHAVAQNVSNNYTLNSDTTPVPVGGEIVVYFTGGGPVTGQNSLVTGGETPPTQFPVTETVTATLAGIAIPAANILYVGLVPSSVGGFYQANIVIPKVASGDRNLVITIGGKASNVTVVSIQ